MEKIGIIFVCTGYFDSNDNKIDCRKIKVDASTWKSEERIREEYPELYAKYITARNNKKLSHGYCIECYEKLMKIIR